MDNTKIPYVFIAVYGAIVLFANFLVKGFPRIPGDLVIERPGGIRIYIPIVSAIILTALAVYVLNNYVKPF